MLPTALFVGMSEKRFWTATPKELEPYILAHKKRQLQFERNAWLQGLYIKAALCGVSLSVSGITDKSYKYMDYPPDPYENEIKRQNAQSEQYVKNERLRAYAFFKNFAMSYKETHGRR